MCGQIFPFSAYSGFLSHTVAHAGRELSNQDTVDWTGFHRFDNIPSEKCKLAAVIDLLCRSRFFLFSLRHRMRPLEPMTSSVSWRLYFWERILAGQISTEAETNLYTWLQDHDPSSQRTDKSSSSIRPLKTKQVSLWIFIFSLVSNWTAFSAEAGGPVPAVETIILRMAQAAASNRAGFRTYTLTRNYTLFAKGGQAVRSQVFADVNFSPPASKRFIIKQTQGQGIGEKIAREMLENEVELTQNGRSEISSENYHFKFLGEANISGHHCYIMGLEPKRQEPYLISGKAWIDSQTFLPHHVEGEPSKKPCWWVRELHVSVYYGNAGGMWLQNSLEFTAGIRLFGDSKMVVRDLKYDIPQPAAIAPAVQNKEAEQKNSPVSKHTSPKPGKLIRRTPSQAGSK